MLPPICISVVVPVLNEAARISAQLAHLRQLAGLHEVIVVDGGSADGTRELVAAAGWPRFAVSTRGRATQMNTGARLATGDVLLFLHADVILPGNVASLVAQALADPRVVAGAFRTQTVAEGRRGWVARWLRLADLRSRYTRLPYGDQALFVRRGVFEQIGGFPRNPYSRTWRSAAGCGRPAGSAPCRRRCGYRGAGSWSGRFTTRSS